MAQAKDVDMSCGASVNVSMRGRPSAQHEGLVAEVMADWPGARSGGFMQALRRECGADGSILLATFHLAYPTTAGMIHERR